VGPRYRLRAKQLSYKLCPIGLSSLTHRSPLLDTIKDDMSDAAVDDLFQAYKDQLQEAGRIRGQLWSGDLDFTTLCLHM
jgi:hypothetical protein